MFMTIPQERGGEASATPIADLARRLGFDVFDGNSPADEARFLVFVDSSHVSDHQTIGEIINRLRNNDRDVTLVESVTVNGTLEHYGITPNGKEHTWESSECYAEAELAHDRARHVQRRLKEIMAARNADPLTSLWNDYIERQSYGTTSLGRLASAGKLVGRMAWLLTAYARNQQLVHCINDVMDLEPADSKLFLVAGRGHLRDAEVREALQRTKYIVYQLAKEPVYTDQDVDDYYGYMTPEERACVKDIWRGVLNLRENREDELDVASDLAIQQ